MLVEVVDVSSVDAACVKWVEAVVGGDPDIVLDCVDSVVSELAVRKCGACSRMDGRLSMVCMTCVWTLVPFGLRSSL